jgi:hypothetical protein
LRATSSTPVLTGLAAVIILVLALSYFCPNSQAQTITNFTPEDKFSIPAHNGTITFAVNGSYSSAALQNQTWSFTNLKLRNSQTLGNLTISVENSNMTIYSYRSTFFTTGATLSCIVQGIGKQTVNFNLNTSRITDASEWTVTIPGDTGNTIFLAEGEGWTLLPDNTMVLTGLTGNLSITHYSGFTAPNNSNQPFFEQHSIIIVTVALVVVTVAVAVAVKLRVRVK